MLQFNTIPDLLIEYNKASMEYPTEAKNALISVVLQEAIFDAQDHIKHFNMHLKYFIMNADIDKQPHANGIFIFEDSLVLISKVSTIIVLFNNRSFISKFSKFGISSRYRYRYQ